MAAGSHVRLIILVDGFLKVSYLVFGKQYFCTCLYLTSLALVNSE